MASTDQPAGVATFPQARSFRATGERSEAVKSGRDCPQQIAALVSAAARHPWRRRVIEALQRLEQMPPSAWDGSGHRLKQTQDRFDDGIKV